MVSKENRDGIEAKVLRQKIMIGRLFGENVIRRMIKDGGVTSSAEKAHDLSVKKQMKP